MRRLTSLAALLLVGQAWALGPQDRVENFRLMDQTGSSHELYYYSDAKAVVVMPGGFGTLDELFELLTLVQTEKIRKHMPIVLFGSHYWAEVINLEALERYGTISPEDVELFFRTDSVDEAFDYITEQLSQYALGTPGATL